MYPKSKIVILLLCIVMLFNFAGCSNKTQKTPSQKDPVSSQDGIISDVDSEAENSSSSEENLSNGGTTTGRTPVYIYDEKPSYSTDRYIPTAKDNAAYTEDESDNEVSAKAVSWEGPDGYVIVIPSGNIEAQKTAELLQSFYKEKANVNLKIVTDAVAAQTKEIVIGNTNRYKYSAKEGEYFAKVSGKKLIFGGGHNVTVKKAVQIQTRLSYQKHKAYEYSGNTDFTGKKLGYTYVWGDEFEGTDIDRTLWCQATKMSATAEMALDNTELTTFIKNGYLNMRALRYYDPKKAGVQFVCPWSLTTLDTMSYKYGYVEIRAKLPFLRGAWASFWTSSSGSLGPKRTADYTIEVDIFENFANLDTISPNVHKWYEDGEHTQWADENEKYTFDSPDINEEYHIYGFEWTPEKMIMYVDDKPYYTYDLSNNFDKGNSGMGGFDTQLYLIFNNHLFTDSSDYKPYEGCEINPTDLPTEYVIDWVRLYQKNDGKSKLYTKY